MTPVGPRARPHLAARVEDAVGRRREAWLRARGWTVRIEAYAGYGAPGWVRVAARAVLAPPAVDDDQLPGAGAAAVAGAPETRSAVRGWRSFTTTHVAGTEVFVDVAGASHRLVTDRGGYVDAVLASGLPTGWGEVTFAVPSGHSAAGPVLVVAPETDVGIISDIDDTVMITRLPRPLVAAWNVFVRHENAREPVPGMAELYAEMLGDRPDAPVVYLSNNAWNAAPALGRFLRRHGYPAGPLLLTDWGPTSSGWFRSGRAHKREQLRRLVRELPQVRWWLVGDDGEHDPEVYAEVAQRQSEHVRGVAIRQLTFSEHILAQGLPMPPPRGRRAPGGRRGRRRRGWRRVVRKQGPPSPLVLLGRDGAVLAERARRAGMLGR